MFNEFVVVVVSAFNKAGSQADKNGQQNVFLQPMAGKIPNKAMVVAGTVATQANLLIGKTLLVNVNERKPDPVYGRQFGHTVIGEVHVSEILGMRKELGAATVIDANDAEEANEGANANTLATSSLPNAANGGATPTLPAAPAPAAPAPAVVEGEQ